MFLDLIMTGARVSIIVVYCLGSKFGTRGLRTGHKKGSVVLVMKNLTSCVLRGG